MGLIKAGVSSIGTSMGDGWKEWFACDAISSDILVSKGIKKTSSKSSNTSGSDNIISNGSVILVADGQCMMIVEQGKIVEFCATPGEFLYSTENAPSLFTGNLGTSILDTFKQIGKRFSFGGDTGVDQRIYYVNIKEILGNKYGTANPVPFRVVDTNIGLDIDISIRCNGEYSYKITNPILFYTNVCGNISNNYNRSEIDSMLKTELLTALQPAFAKISAMGIRYSMLAGHTSELSTSLNDILSEKWQQLRGIEIVSFGVNSAVASKEDEDMIKELQKTAVFRNASMAAANLGSAQAEAMKSAASNTATGPMMAFAGMNMANQTGGINANTLYQMQENNPQNTPQNPIQNNNSSNDKNSWNCACGHKNTGKFCTECGNKPVLPTSWTCSCGNICSSKFCSECGNKNFELICDKCGFNITEKSTKFCPECGDIIDDNDRK